MFVMPGLDPGIHRADAPDMVGQAESGRSVDRRVKPGDDNLNKPDDAD
ncbi:MAG: hypothetical protein WD044_14110 [Dongiaceae bacterium]